LWKPSYLSIFAALQKTLSGVVNMVVRGLALFFLSLLISQNLSARTYPGSYQKDPGADPNHVFGVYKANPSYKEADFAYAMKLSSPLALPKFASYDILIMVSIADSIDPVTQLKIPAQKMRVYAREEVLHGIGDDQFQNVNYDPETGLLFYFNVSTARVGMETPKGYFRPQAFSSKHASSLYNNAPMPWAMFFNGSIATHGVFGNEIAHLGHRASHGCVRMEPQRANDVFQLVGLRGKGDVASFRGNQFLLDAYGEVITETNYKALISVQ
jgi:lipoprotein-anchoring transpeptidase ErfK/SrfK